MRPAADDIGGKSLAGLSGGADLAQSREFLMRQPGFLERLARLHAVVDQANVGPFVSLMRQPSPCGKL
jgi:hypothetical protein